MGLRWRYEGPDGVPVPGPERTFDDQVDAEQWLGTHWPDLLDTGVEAVTLVDGDDEIYGPMSLRPHRE